MTPAGAAGRRAAPGSGRRAAPGSGLRWRRRGIRTAAALAFVLALWLVTAPTGIEAGTQSDLVTPAPVLSASASPGASPGVIETGDPRSNGQGPGLVGSPVEILIGVVLLGAAGAGGTLLYLRLTREG